MASSESDYPDLPMAFLNILTELDRWLDINLTMPPIEDPSCPGTSFQPSLGDDRVGARPGVLR